MILLKTNRLTVEIAEPVEAPSACTRFDTSAFIRQVTLDGRHTFCREEPVRPDLPCTMGTGLCSEIVWPVADRFPPGAWFPKFGVGMLKKPDEKEYSFWRRYDRKIAPVACSCSGNRAFFRTESGEADGYRLRTAKKVVVKENEITVFYRFSNTGGKPLSLREYCHNFITIDNLPIGEDYRLEMNVKPQDGKMPDKEYGTIYGRGRGFSYTGYTGEPFGIKISGKEIEEGPFWWKLTHQKSSISIQETDSFQASRALIWSIGTNISPEISYCFTVRPGESEEYWRKWTFSDTSREEERKPG